MGEVANEINNKADLSSLFFGGSAIIEPCIGTATTRGFADEYTTVDMISFMEHFVSVIKAIDSRHPVTTGYGDTEEIGVALVTKSVHRRADRRLFLR